MEACMGRGGAKPGIRMNAVDNKPKAEKFQTWASAKWYWEKKSWIADLRQTNMKFRCGVLLAGQETRARPKMANLPTQEYYAASDTKF